MYFSVDYRLRGKVCRYTLHLEAKWVDVNNVKSLMELTIDTDDLDGEQEFWWRQEEISGHKYMTF